jgi:hypothetical protein
MFRITLKPLAFGLIIGLIIGVPVGLYLNEIQLTGTAPLPLYEEIYEIKDRTQIKITEANFTNPERTCEWYELREEDSEDYFQTTINFWVFQAGQKEHGDIEAFVEIYNVPNRTDRFIIEITRNCWFELTAYYNGEPFAVFPTVTGNNLTLGYMTYEVPY